MGRRPDAPEVQRAKGYPGKRRGKVDRALADAERRAQAFAALPADDADPSAPPVILSDPIFAAPLAIWRQEAPRLHRAALLDPQFRLLFASFCVYLAEFWQAAQEVQENGFSQMVKTVAGGMMQRISPAVAVRDRAHDRVIELSARFGFTPLDMYRLTKEQFLLRDRLPGGGASEGDLVERARAAEVGDQGGEAAAAAGQPDAEPDVIGILQRFDSAPPGAVH